VNFTYSDEDISDAASPETASSLNDEDFSSDASYEADYVNDDYEPKQSSKVEENKPTSSIQFMITNRMRRCLVQDLGYLPEEVDVMEPQIAAVVIDRSLARPSSGMPASWRVPKLSELQTSTVPSPLKRLLNACMGFSSQVTSQLPALAPAAAALAAAALVKAALDKGGDVDLAVALRGVSHQLSRAAAWVSRISNPRKPVAPTAASGRRQPRARQPGASSSSNQSRRRSLIDLSSLQRVQDDNLFDKLMIKLDIFRKKYQ